MSHHLYGSGEIVRTMDGPFQYRTYIVRPDGSLDEVKPAVFNTPTTSDNDWQAIEESST